MPPGRPVENHWLIPAITQIKTPSPGAYPARQRPARDAQRCWRQRKNSRDILASCGRDEITREWKTSPSLTLLFWLRPFRSASAGHLAAFGTAAACLVLLQSHRDSPLGIAPICCFCVRRAFCPRCVCPGAPPPPSVIMDEGDFFMMAKC